VGKAEGLRIVGIVGAAAVGSVGAALVEEVGVPIENGDVDDIAVVVAALFHRLVAGGWRIREQLAVASGISVSAEERDDQEEKSRCGAHVLCHACR